MLCIIGFLLQIEDQPLRQQKDIDSLCCRGLGWNPQSLEACLYLSLSHVPSELSPKNMGGWVDRDFQMLLGTISRTSGLPVNSETILGVEAYGFPLSGGAGGLF